MPVTKANIIQKPPFVKLVSDNRLSVSELNSIEISLKDSFNNVLRSPCIEYEKDGKESICFPDFVCSTNENVVIIDCKKEPSLKAKMNLYVLLLQFMMAKRGDNRKVEWRRYFELGEQFNWKDRYKEAHENDFKVRYPNAYAIGEYVKPKWPRVDTANGLTNMVENYINWLGYRATRVNVMGRLVEGTKTTESGAVISKKKFIKSSTRRGSADLSSTINGKSVMWEIKINTDRPSPEQLKEQAKERKAGGEYFFIKTPQQFFEEFDRIHQPELFK